MFMITAVEGRIFSGGAGSATMRLRSSRLQKRSAGGVPTPCHAALDTGVQAREEAGSLTLSQNAPIFRTVSTNSVNTIGLTT